MVGAERFHKTVQGVDQAALVGGQISNHEKGDVNSSSDRIEYVRR